MIDVSHFLLVLYICIMCPYVAILAHGTGTLEEIIFAVVKAGLLLHIYLQLTTAIVRKVGFLLGVYTRSFRKELLK